MLIMADEFVENVLSFFLNDKVDVMNHDYLVRLCSSFYDEVKIKDAKRMLFNLLECDGDLVVGRNDARKKNISDMVRLLSTSQHHA